jgi:hypothetical protein
MSLFIFIVCVNTMTSAIKTNVFVDFDDFQVPHRPLKTSAPPVVLGVDQPWVLPSAVANVTPVIIAPVTAVP